MHSYCYGKGNAPPELSTAFDWVAYNTPIAAGGLRDQPMWFFARMKVAHNVYLALQSWRQKPKTNDAGWYEANTDTMRILDIIWETIGADNAVDE